MTVSVQIVVSLDGREITVTDEAESRDDVVEALNRARDQMVLLLARNGLTDEAQT